jgi:hypothetical protein
VECRREDEFAPVKNAEGKDSPETSRAAQMDQARRWLKAAGEEGDLTGIELEVSPLFADSQEAFVAKWQAMAPRPPLVDGLVLE